MHIKEYLTWIYRIFSHPVTAFPATVLLLSTSFAIGSIISIGLEFIPLISVSSYLGGMSVIFAICTILVAALGAAAAMVSSSLRMFREAFHIRLIAAAMVAICTPVLLYIGLPNVFGWIAGVWSHTPAQPVIICLALLITFAYGLYYFGSRALETSNIDSLEKVDQLLTRTAFMGAGVSFSLIALGVSLGSYWIDYQMKAEGRLCIVPISGGPGYQAAILGRTDTGFLLYTDAKYAVRNVSEKDIKIVGNEMSDECRQTPLK